MTGHRHVCLVVDGDDAYRAAATRFLLEGAAAGRKAVAFGPQDSPLRADLSPLTSMVADPYVTVLGRGGLDCDRMFAMFRAQSALAASEGFTGLCVAADMDWLLPARPGPDAVVGFEVLLDRVVAEVGATVLCAYRRGSFDDDLIAGTACAHQAHAGDDVEPPFRLVAGADGGWVLSGAVDLAVAQPFSAALRATAADPWALDVAGLEFIDVEGMRALAAVARSTGVPLRLRRARPALPRYWALAGFDAVAPEVAFTG